MINQISFDPLDYELASTPTEMTAKQDRNQTYYRLRKEGKKVHRWVLTNQLRKWESLGVPDGRVRDVYMLDVYT